MNRLFFLLFFLVPTVHTMAQSDSAYTYVFHAPLPGRITISSAQRLDDSSGLLRFEDVYANPVINSRFSLKPSYIDNKSGYCGWLRVGFRNGSASPVIYMLDLPKNVDSVELYEVQGNALRHYEYGLLIPSRNKIVALRNDIFPLMLRAGEAKTFFVRIKADGFQPVSTSMELISDHAFRGFWYFAAFYLGILILLILISFVLAVIFRDIHYTMLALPLIGMVLWFGDVNGSLYYLFDLPVSWQKYFNPFFSSWLLSVTVLLFHMYYTAMKQKLSWAFYTNYFFILVLIGVSALQYMTHRRYAASSILPLIIAIWQYLPGWYLMRKGDRQAKLILLFFLPFMASAIYHLLQYLIRFYSPIDSFILFQSCSLLSSLIIGYELYYRVRSTVKERLNTLWENNQLEKEKAGMLLKEAEYKSRMNDITFTALRAQMNPHFIFNCLNSIKLYTEQNNTEAASDYLTKFSRLIRNMLDNARAESTVLAKEMESLRLYLEMEAMRFKQKLQYIIHVDDDVDEDFIEVPPLLIQPYVENAIWHGLMHKQEGGTIQINVSQSPDHTLLIITIEDDGIGRDKAAAIKSKSVVQRKSLGTQVTAERIALINEKYKAGAEVIINDLFDDIQQPAGTLVTIKLPIK